MKKIFIALLMVLIPVALVGCGDEAGDGTPTIKLPTNNSYLHTQEFDALEGVVALAGDGKTNITDQVIVQGLQNLGFDDDEQAAQKGNFSKLGKITLKYQIIMDGKVIVNVPRILDVKMDKDIANGLIGNGDFSLETFGWNFVDWQSNLTKEVTNDGMLKISTDRKLANPWDIQLQQELSDEGFTLEAGKTYTLTFDAKADIDGMLIEFEIAHGAPGPVWGYNFGTGGTFTVNTEIESYEYTFVCVLPTNEQVNDDGTPNEDYAVDINKATLSYKLGGSSNPLQGITPEAAIYFGNIKLIEVAQ